MRCGAMRILRRAIDRESRGIESQKSAKRNAAEEKTVGGAMHHLVMPFPLS